MSAESVEALVETILDYEATCDSLEETTAEGYAQAILASPAMRDLLAQVWDEGWDDYDNYAGGTGVPPPPRENPYREEQS